MAERSSEGERGDDASPAAGESAALSDNFVNDSAMMIAYERALESKRPDALFQDEFADVMAGSKGAELSANFGGMCSLFKLDGWPEFHKQWTAVRTRFIDDAIQARADTGGFAQIVNLGAGMDTRAYRMQCFAKFDRAFDVDMAGVNESRQKVFRDVLRAPKAHCPVISVDIDFLDEQVSVREALVGRGFDAEKPSVFFAEGLIMYLGAAGKVKFLREVSAAAAPGSVFVLQFLDPGDADGDAAQAALTEAEARDALGAGGWAELQCWKFGEEGLNFGRFPLDKFGPCCAFSFAVACKR